MNKFITVPSILACTFCISGTAKAQNGGIDPDGMVHREYTQLPDCPGRWIFEGRDESNNVTFVHCECSDGSYANDTNGMLYCMPPQSQNAFQQPAQIDPAQEIINQMLGNAAAQFGSPMGDALGKHFSIAVVSCQASSSPFVRFSTVIVHR